MSIRKALIGVLLFTALAGLGAQGANMAFNWAFVKRATDGSPVPIVFSERVAVAPGDLFKIYIQPVKNTFIYLFLYDAQGALQLLFPERFEVFTEPSYLQKQFFIPEGENWFALDNAKGVERFYLLASRERLTTLESLTLAHQKVADAKSSATVIGAARQAVLNEIAQLRTKHSQLTIAAEKPVTIAGGTRGINASVAKAGTRIEAAEFYIKTFRLEH
ncbi:MAG: DUF4384 domain-containing protein [Spirochaetia bacterium]|jgi:hypothetical protein